MATKTIDELSSSVDDFVAAILKLAELALANQAKIPAAEQAKIDTIADKLAAGTAAVTDAIAKLTPA